MNRNRPNPVTVARGSILSVAVHLLLVAAFSRHLSGSSETGGSDATPRADGAGDPETETVACPDCSIKTERGYEYCANCVGKLPGAVSRMSSGSVPSRQGIL